jgi:hypothetical protein
MLDEGELIIERPEPGEVVWRGGCWRSAATGVSSGSE